MDTLGLRESRVLVVPRVTLELKDYRVIAEFPDNLVTQVSLVKVATLDKKVTLDILESLGCPVRPGSPGCRVIQELKDYLATLEPMVYQAIAESVVLAANQVIVESVATPAYLDTQDSHHTQVLVELLGIRASQGTQVSKVIPVIQVTMEILGTRVLADSLESKVSLVIVGSLESQVTRVYLDLVATAE